MFDYPGCRAKNEAALVQALRQQPARLFKNFDAAGPIQVSGADLMAKGLEVRIPDKPGTAVIIYKKI